MPAPLPSALDANQVLQHSFEDSTGRLRVDAAVTVVLGEVEVIIDHTEDSIRIGDGVSLVTTTTVGPDVGLDVNIINTSLPFSATDLDIRDLLHTQDSVRVGDGTTLTQVSGQGELYVVDGVSLPNNDIVDVLIANTEYFYTFPQPTKKFLLRSRGNSTLRISYTLGEVVGGTNYMTIPVGSNYLMDNINLASALTIYISSSKPSETVEIESWG